MRDFFTIPDPDLTQESSVDPMGLQAIWTHYGQAIFNQRITTVANDLRIFTVNLFHNHLLNKFFKEYPEELQQVKSYYRLWQNEYNVKAGILMFLEDLVTWSFYLHDDESEVEIDKLGILGLNKARGAAHSRNEDEIFLVASKRGGLLKNQINLGMTGRYKGPMMNMEFFDRSMTYLPSTWEHVDRFMKDWVDANELEKALVKLITRFLFACPKRDAPQMSLAEVKNTGYWRVISRGYITCFGKRKLPKDIRAYWRDKLGLQNGAARALFNQIGQLDQGEYIDHEYILSMAGRSVKSESQELEKITNIIKIEPFLSHSEYLLRFIAQPSIKQLKDISNDIDKLRNEIIKAGSFNIEKPFDRLVEVSKVMRSSGNTEEWLRSILSYHSKIMASRGGNMWVELTENGTFKHYFGGNLREGINTVAKYLKSNHWFHTYYLETLRSIYLGMN